MKIKIAAVLAPVLLLAAVTGCSSLKASLDNATVKKGWHYDDKGKLTDDPVASVPLWSSKGLSSKGLKEKPADVTPPRK
jgi:hypothetical protein